MVRSKYPTLTWRAREEPLYNPTDNVPPSPFQQGHVGWGPFRLESRNFAQFFSRVAVDKQQQGRELVCPTPRQAITPIHRASTAKASTTRATKQPVFGMACPCRNEAGPAPRLPPASQARQRVRGAGGDPRGQLLALVARPLLPQGRWNDLHVLGDGVDSTVDCRRHR